MSVQDKAALTGPRKLLALDGGGIRGMITVEILAQLESELQQRLGADDTFVLADYFDYIAGTSTGAIIATCLSLGMRVAEIRQFYLDSGAAMFEKSGLINRYLRNKYKDEKLAQKLQEVIQQQAAKNLGKEQKKTITLGSDALKTYLLLILRNATTDSPWPLSNNPKARYNDITRKNCNLHLPLWQLVRASTAAPTYFPPEVITVGDQEFIFVDGGVTMYNNPAFQLFLMATVEPYKLRWETGEDDMLLVSIGTGSAANANKNLAPDEMNILYNAPSIPAALMYAASNEQDLLCRVFGRCRHGADIDREVLDLKGDIGPGSLEKKFFTYLRYNADLSDTGLMKLSKEALNTFDKLSDTAPASVAHILRQALDLSDIEPKQVQQMDSVEFIPQLQRVGQAVAMQIKLDEHFAGFVPQKRS